MTKLKEKMDEIKRYMAESWTMSVFTGIAIFSLLCALSWASALLGVG